MVVDYFEFHHFSIIQILVMLNLFQQLLQTPKRVRGDVLSK